jgi:hypothetical protein
LKSASEAEGDTPESVQAQMIAGHTDWLRRARIAVAVGVPVGLSPRFALDAEQLAEKAAVLTERRAPNKGITEPTYLC